ncbi:MAG TPA: STAS domain-containing protein [Xanthobacteraceae bacterium]|nr:STAS domain-containing protein [Xanthobacteraceae bacterium]
MKITITEFDDLGTRISLDGKLDIRGAGELDQPLSTVAATRRNIVVDMAAVDFISSMGIRHLVTAAKAIGRNGKVLCLLNPGALVSDVLRTAGLDEYLKVVRSEDEVRALLITKADDPRQHT